MSYLAPVTWTGRRAASAAMAVLLLILLMSAACSVAFAVTIRGGRGFLLTESGIQLD